MDASSRGRDSKIYILPTGHGLAFLAGIVVMILTAATYSNNLVYLLAFFLFSIVMISMVHTHNNLLKVEISVLQIQEGFSGEWVQLDLRVSHTSKTFRHGIRVFLSKQDFLEAAQGEVDTLSPRGQSRLQLVAKAHRRGEFLIRRLRLESRFPLGLFRAWKWVPVDVEFCIYPALKGRRHFPKVLMESEGGQSQRRPSGLSQDTDFKEHRAHREGESYRHVDWKAFARSGQLLTKTFEGEIDTVHSFRYSALSGKDIEQKLSQLALWIHEAHRRGHAFELVLPQRRIEVGEGLQHYRSSLRELARFHESIA